MLKRLWVIGVLVVHKRRTFTPSRFGEGEKGGVMRHYLRQAGNNGRRRVLVLALVISFGAVLLTSSSASAGGNAGFGCAKGFDVGALTFEQSLALPRIQAGLGAGVFDVAILRSVFDGYNRNGDELICFKDVGALNGDEVFWQFSYNVVDNNASVPGS